MISGSALLAHGAIVVVLGVLAGIPFWFAIISKRTDAQIRAWRVAHGTLVMDGLLLLVAGLLVPHLPPTSWFLTALRWSLVASAYSFAVALIGGALIGERGLTPEISALGRVMFVAHVVGATGAVIGTVLLVLGLTVWR
jgi:hypothetical protein